MAYYADLLKNSYYCDVIVNYKYNQQQHKNIEYKIQDRIFQAVYAYCQVKILRFTFLSTCLGIHGKVGVFSISL